jgi:WD40 repeat protein
MALAPTTILVQISKRTKHMSNEAIPAMITSKSSFYVTGGNLRRDAPSYVERQADVDLYTHLRQGEFSFVLDSRQMGKSSLMVRVAARLREEGIAVVTLDLSAIGQNLTAEQWCAGLLEGLGTQLDLEEELEQFWQERQRLGPIQRWMAALRHVVLAQVPGQIVLFIDEIDYVRTLPFSTDELFAAIRECYNRRAEDPELHRLTFCLLGVATPSDLIQDPLITPFNIGRRIELTDFTEREAGPLARGLGEAALGRRLLGRVLHWTGGHPYLTQRLCQAVAEEGGITSPAGVDRVCERLFLTRGAREREDNLAQARKRLLESGADRASVLDLYAQVLRERRVAADETNPVVSVLRLSGITRPVNGYLRVRNRIYGRVFDSAWVRENMPNAELRRQRAAYRRGLMRAAAVMTIVVGSVALAASAWRLAVLQTRAADSAQRVAQLEKRLRSSAQRSEARERQSEARARWAEGRARHLAALAESAKEKECELRIQAQKAEQQATASAVLAKQKAGQAREQQHLARLEAARARHARDAEKLQRAIAGREAAGARRLLYDVSINEAQAALHEGNVLRVQQLLDDQVPRLGHEDLRDFGWYYLWEQLCGAVRTLGVSAAPVVSVAFSPNGRMLASGSSDGTMKLWDVTTGRSWTLTDHANVVRSLASLLDGKTLANGRPPLPVTGPADRVSPLAFSADGSKLASGSRDGKVKVWDVATRRDIRTFTGHKDRVLSVAFSPDGRTLASGSLDETVRLWDVDTGRTIRTLPGHSGGALSVAFSPDGSKLASGSGSFTDATVKLWDVATGADQTRRGLRGGVLSVAFSPDGSKLASGSGDQSVRLWSLDTGGLSKTSINLPTGHHDRVWSVAFSPDSKTLASGSWDRTVILWDLATGHTQTLRGHTSYVLSVAFSPNPKAPMLASGSDDGTVKLWNMTTTRPHLTVTGPTDRMSLAFSPNGRTLASGCGDRMLRLWDAATRRLITTLTGHKNGVNSVTFSPDGDTLASGSGDRTVKLWDVATGRTRTLIGHKNSVNTAAFSPDGRTLASGSDDGTVILWDVATGHLVHTFRGHTSNVLSVAFALKRKGPMLASGSDDGTVKLWDVNTGRSWTLTGHTAAVSSVAFSPDGTTLASGSWDRTMRLWDVATGHLHRTLTGHEGAVHSVAFSPDGTTLASGGGDGTVKLWDVSTGRPTLTLTSPVGDVLSVAFSPDGTTLVSGTDDGMMWLWQAASRQDAPRSEQGRRAAVAPRPL